MATYPALPDCLNSGEAVTWVAAILITCASLGCRPPAQAAPRVHQIQSVPGSSETFVTIMQGSEPREARHLEVLAVDFSARTSRRLFALGESLSPGITTMVAPDRQRIVLEDVDIRVFETNTGRLLGSLAEDGEGLPLGTAWSPDSRYLAVALMQDDPHVIWLELWSPGAEPMPTGIVAKDLRTFPVLWSPDGSRLVFLAWVLGGPENVGRLVLQDVRSGQRAEVAPRVDIHTAAAWRPGSHTIVWTQERERKSNRVTEFWARDLEAPEPRLGPQIPGVVGSPFWSPDGKWLAFSWLPPVRQQAAAGKIRCVLPATSILQSKESEDPRDSIVRVPIAPRGGLWYGWSGSSELLFTEDRQVVKAFNPETRKTRFVFALTDGKITFSPR